MKLLKGLSVLVAVAGLGVLLLIAAASISGHPLEALSQSASKGDLAQRDLAQREPVASVGVQSDRSEPRLAEVTRNDGNPQRASIHPARPGNGVWPHRDGGDRE